MWLISPLWAIRTDTVAIVSPYDHVLAMKVWRQGISDDEYNNVAASFARNIYNSKLAEVGKDIFIDKTPRYYHILPWIDALFPKAIRSGCREIHWMCFFPARKLGMSKLMNWLERCYRHIHSILQSVYCSFWIVLSIRANINLLSNMKTWSETKKIASNPFAIFWVLLSHQKCLTMGKTPN
jgi:hypothetical protein